jgi:uncharacterized membrane protein YfcA
MPDIGLFDLAIFLAGAFAAAFVTGLAGFAFGMVAAAIWLHALTPVQAIALIVAYALLVQGYAVWKLKQALNVGRLIPFIAGSAVGIPVGVIILKWASPSDLRIAVGLLLILFSLYNLIRPKLPQAKQAGSLLDAIVGVFNGLLAGSTGLGGILPTIWCGVRGWSKDEQRAVFQPTAVATFLMTIVWLGGAGTLTADIGRLFAIGLPALIAGTWLGWKLYGRLDEATFRKVVLFVLLASGVTLVLTWS